MVARSDRASFERTRLALARALRAARAANDRRAAAVRGDLARLGSVEQLQKIGRLLLAQGGKLPKGATTALLEDWEDGGQLEVTLDPSRPAKSQAETFFAKARRYQRGEAMMRKRLAECESRASALAALEQEIAAGDPSAHDEWRMLVARARALGVKVDAASHDADGASERSRADRPTKRAPFHVFRDERGRKILVGRGGRDNDELTTQVARPQDLWLHAKGRAGAHVVVLLDKGQDCPSETLVDAATLAAHFSDARGEAVCEVSYLPRKYVRKRKGGPPGSVTFDHEKVLLLRVEPSRLERLLSTREG
jgi:predicted ribosome quality control (RQC) complex YloA/Tae2 family protein